MVQQRIFAFSDSFLPLSSVLFAILVQNNLRFGKMRNIPKTFQETNIDETWGVNYMEIPVQHILKYWTV